MAVLLLQTSSETTAFWEEPKSFMKRTVPAKRRCRFTMNYKNGRNLFGLPIVVVEFL